MHYIRIALTIASSLVGAFGLQADANPKEISIAVVPKGTDKERWKAIHSGAMKASEELANEGLIVNILWKGSLDSRRDEQIQVVDTFTGQRLSGILVASLSEDQLSGQSRIDANSDLPMVFIDSTLDANRPISYVATDNFQGGSIAADRIGQLTEGVGNVIVVRYQQGDTNSEAREAGFIEQIKTRYPSIRLISIDQYSGDDKEKAYNVSEYLLNRYGRRVNAIFASSANGTDSMLMALRNFSLTEQVHLVGYESSSLSLEAIKTGEIKGLVVSNPFRMGYLGVTTLVDHMQGGNMPTIVNTGVTLVTQSNIDSPEVREALGIEQAESSPSP